MVTNFSKKIILLANSYKCCNLIFEGSNVSFRTFLRRQKLYRNKRASFDICVLGSVFIEHKRYTNTRSWKKIRSTHYKHAYLHAYRQTVWYVLKNKSEFSVFGVSVCAKEKCYVLCMQRNTSERKESTMNTAYCLVYYVWERCIVLHCNSRRFIHI